MACSWGKHPFRHRFSQSVWVVRGINKAIVNSGEQKGSNHDVLSELKRTVRTASQWGEEQMNPYRAYLLRLWLADLETTGIAGWRASLEDSSTGERLGFASLEQLFAFLLTLTEGTGGQAQGTSPDATDPPG
jgi:hypothetical protein